MVTSRSDCLVPASAHACAMTSWTTQPRSQSFINEKVAANQQRNMIRAGRKKATNRSVLWTSSSMKGLQMPCLIVHHICITSLHIIICMGTPEKPKSANSHTSRQSLKACISAADGGVAEKCSKSHIHTFNKISYNTPRKVRLHT